MSSGWSSYDENGNIVSYNGTFQEYNEIVEENTDFQYDAVDKTVSIIKQIPSEANKTFDSVAEGLGTTATVLKNLTILASIVASVYVLKELNIIKGVA